MNGDELTKETTVMREVNVSRFRWFLLVVSVLSFISLNMNMVSFAPLLGKISQSLGVGQGAATQLMSIFVFSGALALILGGFLCDRIGITALLVIGNICGALPALLMPWFDSYTAVLGARFFEGLAVGFCLSTMSPTLAIWFPLKERGLASGLMGTAIAIGGALGAILSPLIFVSAGDSWRLMSAWLSIVGWMALILGIVAHLISRTLSTVRNQGSIQASNAQGAFKTALARPSTWIGVAVTFFAAWCMQAIYNLTPAYLEAAPEGLGLGPILAGRLGSSIGIAGIVAPIIGGILQDTVFKHDAKPLMYAGFILCGIFSYALLMPFIHTNRVYLIGSLVLAGAGFSIIYPAITVYVSGAYPVSILGKMLGLWMGLGAFGGALGLFLGGLSVARFGSYQVSITLISLAGLTGFILLFFLAKPTQPETAGIQSAAGETGR